MCGSFSRVVTKYCSFAVKYCREKVVQLFIEPALLFSVPFLFYNPFLILFRCIMAFSAQRCSRRKGHLKAWPHVWDLISCAGQGAASVWQTTQDMPVKPTWDHSSIACPVWMCICIGLGFLYGAKGTMLEICLRAAFAWQLACKFWLTVWLFKLLVDCVFPAAAPGIALHKRTECFREWAGLTKTGLCFSRRSPNCSWLLNNVSSWKAALKSVLWHFML